VITASARGLKSRAVRVAANATILCVCFREVSEFAIH
jgi:hypothetical protein